MVSTVVRPNEGEGENDLVTLIFEISFHKQVVVPDRNGDPHDFRIRCLGRHHEIIGLGPLGCEEPRDSERSARDLVKDWIEKRALLSVALAFLDAEFAQALPNQIPPAPKKKKPKK